MATAKINVRFFNDDGTPDNKTAMEIAEIYGTKNVSVHDGVIKSKKYFSEKECLLSVLHHYLGKTNFEGIYYLKHNKPRIPAMEFARASATLNPFVSDLKFKKNDVYGAELDKFLVHPWCNGEEAEIKYTFNKDYAQFYRNELYVYFNENGDEIINEEDDSFRYTDETCTAVTPYHHINEAYEKGFPIDKAPENIEKFSLPLKEFRTAVKKLKVFYENESYCNIDITKAENGALLNGIGYLGIVIPCKSFPWVTITTSFGFLEYIFENTSDKGDVSFSLVRKEEVPHYACMHRAYVKNMDELHAYFNGKEIGYTAKKIWDEETNQKLYTDCYPNLHTYIVKRQELLDYITNLISEGTNLSKELLEKGIKKAKKHGKHFTTSKYNWEIYCGKSNLQLLLEPDFKKGIMSVSFYLRASANRYYDGQKSEKIYSIKFTCKNPPDSPVVLVDNLFDVPYYLNAIDTEFVSISTNTRPQKDLDGSTNHLHLCYQPYPKSDMEEYYFAGNHFLKF